MHIMRSLGGSRPNALAMGDSGYSAAQQPTFVQTVFSA